MSYTKPFAVRAPSYRQVEYEFTYDTEAAARDAHDALKNKMYTLTDSGDYILPVGHMIQARDEAVSGKVLTFVGQLKAAELQAGAPRIQALESQVAGAHGSMTAKNVR